MIAVSKKEIVWKKKTVRIKTCERNVAEVSA